MTEVLTEVVNCYICNSNSSTAVDETHDYEYGNGIQKFLIVKCSSCDHIYLNPRPLLSEAYKIYNNYYTESSRQGLGSVALKAIKEFILYNRLKKLLAGLKQRAVVLEIGCGSGELLLVLARLRPDIRIYANDLSITDDRKKLFNQAGIVFVSGPAEDLKLDVTVDLVIMNQLIEHLWDCRKVLVQIYNMLSKDGRVSIVTPNIESYDRHFFANGAWGGYHAPRHLNFFSRLSFIELCRQLNFEVLEHRYLVAPLVWIASCQNFVSKRKYLKLRHFFVYKNILLLFCFTLADSIALLLKYKTSNQQFIIKKL